MSDASRISTGGWRRGTCAYCRVPLGPREWDHVQPVARQSGAPGEGETVPACSRCNRLKGARVEAADPHTGRVVPLFDPRSARWEDHFHRPRPDLLAGVTPEGRATAALMFRPTAGFPPDTSTVPFRELTDDHDALSLAAEAQVAYAQNRWAELAQLRLELWQAATETDARTSDYLIHAGVELDGSTATKRALPADHRTRGLQNLHLIRSRPQPGMDRHVMECWTAAADHRRHTVGDPTERARLGRLAVEGYLAMARRFNRPVDLLRAAAITIQCGAPVTIDPRHRQEMAERSLAEARRCTFSTAAMLLDVLAETPDAHGLHASLSAEIEPLTETSGLGQGLDLVEESVLRRAVTVARLEHSTGTDGTPLIELLSWTTGLGMFNEAAEVVAAASGLARRGRVPNALAEDLATRLTRERARAEARDRRAADDRRTP